MKKEKNIKDFEIVTKGYFNVPIEGNNEADEVWSILFNRNIEDLKNKAHSLFNQGLEYLSISSNHIPKLHELSFLIKNKTGWVLTLTDNEYSIEEDWFDHLSQKSFLITKVIRSRENLDYTPFPEAFHDIFGHVPFLCSEKYMKIVHKLAIKWNSLNTEEEKQKLTNFWWYVIEFGLMKENGEIKAFGAGLMSSFGERQNAFSNNVILRPFNVEEMKNTSISDHEFHKKLFIMDSLEQVENVIDKWE